jgi:hypothetical protein
VSHLLAYGLGGLADAESSRQTPGSEQIAKHSLMTGLSRPTEHTLTRLRMQQCLQLKGSHLVQTRAVRT